MCSCKNKQTVDTQNYQKDQNAKTVKVETVKIVSKDGLKSKKD